MGDVTSYPIHVRFLETPVIKNYRLTNGVFVIDFEGAEGLRYYVDYRDFVGATSWTATFPVTGSGIATNISAPLGGLSQRFYQLRVD